jgi:hypothetical protein
MAKNHVGLAISTFVGVGHARVAGVKGSVREMDKLYTDLSKHVIRSTSSRVVPACHTQIRPGPHALPRMPMVTPLSTLLAPAP